MTACVFHRAARARDAWAAASKAMDAAAEAAWAELEEEATRNGEGGPDADEIDRLLSEILP